MHKNNRYIGNLDENGATLLILKGEIVQIINMSKGDG